MATCKQTGKVIWTEDEAYRVLERIQSRKRDKGQHRQERRAYECGYCGKWHLTSKRWHPAQFKT